MRKPIIKSCVGSYQVPIDMSFTNRTSGYTYPLEINTYSPVTEIIDRPSANNYLEETFKFKNNHNNLSIMMSIALGDFKLLLCSDVENDTIDIIQRDLNEDDKKFFSNDIHFFKIPHHSSKSSENIFNLTKNVFMHNSVTTIYDSSELPKEEMLNKYKKKSERIFCTSNLDNCNKYNYGVVEITTDIINRTIKVEDKKYDETEV